MKIWRVTTRRVGGNECRLEHLYKEEAYQAQGLGVGYYFWRISHLGVLLHKLVRSYTQRFTSTAYPFIISRSLGFTGLRISTVI